jgi:capsular polysaccharide biosynthesis protein
MKLGAIDGEGALEHLLRNDGWTIVHPQEHSVRQQLALIDSAAVIGGTEGSAFHTLILAANVEARLLILARDRNVGPNYLAIAHAKNLDQTATTIATAHYDTVRMKPLFRLLDVPGTAAAVRAFSDTFDAIVPVQ